jgi:DNA repair protein SbcC/Rad50
MRPLNLKLEGFTCYSDAQEIDFSSFDVFVICGPTGAGKSTIPDAISYALYGRVPRYDGTSGLISHNRDSMRVALEFQAGGRRYRVHRGINLSRSTGRDGREKINRSPSPVQFEEEVNGEWRSLEGRVKGIDDAIRNIVGLDFSSFERCVLLPQGQFQELLAGDKDERRKVLKNVLDMWVYDRMMQSANQTAAALKVEWEGLQRRLAEDYADATEAALEACRAARPALQKSLEAIRKEVKALHDGVELAGKVRDARARQQKRLLDVQDVQGELDHAEKLAAEGEDLIGDMKRRIQKTESKLAASNYDRQMHARLHSLKEIAGQLTALTDELEGVRRAASDVERQGEAKERLKEAESVVVGSEAARRQAEVALDEARRLDAAAHVRSGLKPGDACTVCGNTVVSLPPTRGSQLSARTAELEKQAGAHSAALAARDDARRTYDLESTRLATAREELTDLEKRRAKLEERLHNEAPADLRTVVDIERAFHAQEKACATHGILERDLKTLQDDARRLEQQLTSSQGQLAGLRIRSAALLEEAEEAGREADGALHSLKELVQRWLWGNVAPLIEQRKDPRQALEGVRLTKQGESEDLAGRLAELAADEKRISDGIVQAAQLREEATAKSARADLHRELGNLLRNNAFQEWFLDEAMGVLAETASKHLETLHPRFALEVEKGEFHVIDHWQADQKRPARTLSGGESFVASLALALALSERLPELRSAAAAPLESLFLDEGFGTLDPQTLDVVINALEELRSKERLVGIISHVGELSERIETRIEVTPSPEGSHLAVVGA